MKVYLHFEESSGPSQSVGIEIDEKSSTLQNLIDFFVSKYNATHQDFVLDTNTVRLFNSEGKILPSATQLSDTEVSEKDDIMVTGAVTRGIGESSIKKESMPAVIVDTAQRQLKNPAEITAVKAEIDMLIANKNYRKARILSEKCLPLYPRESHIFLAAIARTKLANKNFNSATEYATLAVKAATKVKGDISALKFMLAEALFGSDDKCDEADELLEKMLEKKLPANLPQSFTFDVRALRAECLFNLNRHEAAANSINEYMHWKGAEAHLPTLLAYARFSMTYRKIEESIRAMLKAIVIDQKSAQCRKILAELLSSDAGYNELIKQVPPTKSSAAAYAFLATSVKECSAMVPCIRLLSEALALQPQSSSFALNLIHAHETTCDVAESLHVIKSFCSANLLLKVGVKGFSCADLLSALSGAMPGGNCAVTPASVYSAGPKGQRECNPSGLQYDFSAHKCDVNISDSAGHVKEQYSKDDLDLLAIAFTCVKIHYLAGNFSALPALHDLIEPTRRASLESLHTTTVRNEHAYYRCVIKVLAERGVTVNIGTDPYVLQTSSTAGDGLKNKPQHTLDILAAGAGMRQRPCEGFWSSKLGVTPTLVEAASLRPIYVCGDSHCLSPAWSVIDTRESTVSHGAADRGTAATESVGGGSTPRLIVPHLVTGVKQWHLRPDSVFYPKSSFERNVEAIPSGADVVFIIGEIDCREGLLVAVERDQYASLLEGMERTVDIFVAVLVKILKAKNFNVFIHPVAPVLNETRAVVKQFNAVYRAKMEKIKGVVWLDFFEQLLTADQKDLEPSYEMDDTHLNPKYVSLLESAFQRHYSRSGSGLGSPISK